MKEHSRRSTEQKITSAVWKFVGNIANTIADELDEVLHEWADGRRASRANQDVQVPVQQEKQLTLPVELVAETVKTVPSVFSLDMLVKNTTKPTVVDTTLVVDEPPLFAPLIVEPPLFAPLTVVPVEPETIDSIMVKEATMIGPIQKKPRDPLKEIVIARMLARNSHAVAKRRLNGRMYHVR